MAKQVTEVPRFESWQFWKVAVKRVGAAFIAGLYGVDKTTVYDWAKNPNDPNVKRKSKRDPLMREFILFERMDEIGYGQFAKVAHEYLGSAFEEDLNEINIKDILPTFDKEKYADIPATIRWHESMDEYREAKKNGAEEGFLEGLMHRVNRLYKDSKAEHERTNILFMEEAGYGTLRN